jgi:adenine-specific DNA-methyltransferase
LIQFGSDDIKDCFILDSFAGSGTTMQAVMELNKEDGGNRTCIMVQMAEATKDEPKKNICKDITRERVKRAMDKYQYQDGFRYLKVGIAIDAETLLSGNLPTWKQFAEYVYYLCTGSHIKDKKNMNEKTYYVGSFDNGVIYLVYKKDSDSLSKMAINLESAKTIIAAHPKKRIIIYAPSCFLEESFMDENQIEFVGIPYNLFKKAET